MIRIHIANWKLALGGIAFWFLGQYTGFILGHFMFGVFFGCIFQNLRADKKEGKL